MYSFKSKHNNWESIREYLASGRTIKRYPTKSIKSYDYRVKCNQSHVDNTGKRINECGIRYTTKRRLYAGAVNIMKLN